jgi:hypothetical protein
MKYLAEVEEQALEGLVYVVLRSVPMVCSRFGKHAWFYPFLPGGWHYNFVTFSMCLMCFPPRARV